MLTQHSSNELPVANHTSNEKVMATWCSTADFSGAFGLELLTGPGDAIVKLTTDI